MNIALKIVGHGLIMVTVSAASIAVYRLTIPTQIPQAVGAPEQKYSQEIFDTIYSKKNNIGRFHTIASPTDTNEMILARGIHSANMMITALRRRIDDLEKRLDKISPVFYEA